jgi:hypothetical protein
MKFVVEFMARSSPLENQMNNEKQAIDTNSDSIFPNLSLSSRSA